MGSYDELYGAIPSLRGKGRYGLVVNVEVEKLIRLLEHLQYKIYLIEGARISDRQTFFAESARGLDLPEDVTGWDYWSDLFFEFAAYVPDPSFCIVWKDADHLLQHDLQTFLSACCFLTETSVLISAGRLVNPGGGPALANHFEYFLVGSQPAFGAKIDLPDTE